MGRAFSKHSGEDCSRSRLQISGAAFLVDDTSRRYRYENSSNPLALATSISHEANEQRSKSSGQKIGYVSLNSKHQTPFTGSSSKRVVFKDYSLPINMLEDAITR